MYMKFSHPFIKCRVISCACALKLFNTSIAACTWHLGKICSCSTELWAVHIRICVHSPECVGRVIFLKILVSITYGWNLGKIRSWSAELWAVHISFSIHAWEDGHSWMCRSSHILIDFGFNYPRLVENPFMKCRAMSFARKLFNTCMDAGS